LEPRKSRDIDLRRFVPLEQLDPMFFERGYYLTPGSDSTKAYRLLAQVMEKNKRAGIATFVMRDKEYLVAITAEKGILRAETMRFADEIRSPRDVGLSGESRVSKAEVTRFEREIAKHEEAKLSPKELEDRYAQRLLKLVKQKERRKEDVYDAPVEEEESEEGEESVIDLMEVLKRSLQSGAPARKRAARKSARKRKSA
jgi:DNA end-binding protein Ku